MRILAITNQKGGVGKTTTCVNLAASLAALGKRVLLIDLDPQGNATMSSGVDKRELPLSVYDVLLGSAGVAEARVRSHWGEEAGRQKVPTYDVLGANRDLAGAEVELVNLEQREMRLKQAIAEVNNEYDIVLIDCPPSLSMLTLISLDAREASETLLAMLMVAADWESIEAAMTLEISLTLPIDEVTAFMAPVDCSTAV